MNNQTIISKITALAVFLALLWFNIGSALGEKPPNGLYNAQSQARKDHGRLANPGDQDWQEDRSQRFKELEWLIMQNLLAEYQRLEITANLEDNLD